MFLTNKAMQTKASIGRFDSRGDNSLGLADRNRSVGQRFCCNGTMVATSMRSAEPTYSRNSSFPSAIVGRESAATLSA